jgi:hypothetical protein
MVEKMAYQLGKGGYLNVIDDEEIRLLPGRPAEETSSAELLAYIHDSKKERTQRAGLMTDRNVFGVLKLAEVDALDAIKDITIKQLASNESLFIEEKP